MIGKESKKIWTDTVAVFSALFLVLLTALATLPQTRLPDLVVSNAAMEPDGSGAIAEMLSVTVSNRCNGPAAPSYVLATFKQNADPEAKPIYFVGCAIKSLRGGESVTKIFDLKGKNIAFGTFVLIEADPYKKVPETDENNNWRTVFPDGAAADQEQCSGKQ